MLHVDSPRAGGSTLALTQGADVHFAPGAYQPGTPGGDHLIAHELAHVAQQRRGPIGGDVGTAALEADAERAAASGRPDDVLLGAPAGLPQAYEANEHEGLGNAAGGDKVTIVTKNGVRLTYGQVVALSGDFYRSPEALMNAPADELRKILAVMAHEKALVGKTGGKMTGPDAATLNSEYEAATSGSDRAEHHDHSSFSDHDDHGHDDLDADEEHEDEEHVHGGEKPRRMTKYGPMVGDESVEDAGEPSFGPDGKPVQAGQLPSATGSFLDLADENSSHFSPENIRLNFKPKHLLALDLAREAWEARNPGKKAPAVPTGAVNADAKKQGEGGEAGAAPSARMHNTPTQEGAKETGADPAKPGADPKLATPVHADENSKGAGDQQEARALMTSGFAAHFLTDAFAGGHVVSGVFGRKSAPAWFASQRAAVQAALERHYVAEGSWGVTAKAKAAGMLSAIEGAGGVPGIMLKLVHDKFNEQGVKVKNAKGTVWATKGDGHLSSSPETKAQAEAATKTARDAVQETVKTGETKTPYEALDYVPDVAMTPGSKSWRPIEEAATDPTVFDEVWKETMTTPGDVFYTLVKGYIGKLPSLLASKGKLAALKALEAVKRKARKYLKKIEAFGGKLKQLGSDAIDKLKELGSGAIDKVAELGEAGLEKAKEIGRSVKQVGSAAVDKVKEIGSGIGGWFSDRWDDAKSLGSGVVDKAKQLGSGAIEKGQEAASGIGGWLSEKWNSAKSAAGNAWDAAKELGGGAIDKAKQVGSGVGEWLGDAWDVASRWGADKVNGLVEGAKSVGSGAKAIADEVVGMFSSAKRSVAGWLGDKAQELLGGGGKEGAAPTTTGPVSEVRNQTYAHGGFMGAAGAFMQDPRWSAIFRTLMPAAYERAAKIAEPEKLQLELENNPVLAAYGSVRHLQEVTAAGPGASTPGGAHRALPLEWDVWLPPDPKQVTDLANVKIAHGNLGTTVAQGVGGEDPVGYARDDVKHSPHAGQWMELFGKAVALYRGEPAGGDADAKRRDEQLKQLQAGTTGDAAVGIAKEFLGAEGGLILDVKSTYSTPADIAAFVKFLKGQGINVFGVGTFKPDQLAALGDDTRKVTFFHGINDMESKSAALTPGADVMFNGGSLLNGGPEYLVAGRDVYEINQGAYLRLVALQRRLALNIGLYVQESAVAPDAIQKITELVNRNPSVFTRGFAYGNVSGSAEGETTGTGMGAQKWMDW